MKLKAFGYTREDNNEICEKEVKLAKRAISEMGLQKTKRINKRASTSYTIKHVASAYLQKVLGVDNGYMTNGAFIKAMIDAGFDVDIHAPNAYFNVGMRELSAARIEISGSRYSL